MIIGIDYDKTYTADPSFWNDFIQLALDSGHHPFICTHRDHRYDKTDDLLFLEENDVEVVYTCGGAKKWWCEQFTDFKNVDVWIDDRPETVLFNSPMTPTELEEWRAENAAAA